MAACVGATSIWFCDVVRIHNLLAIPFGKLYRSPVEGVIARDLQTA
jgi:hypothetical protein